MKALVEATQAEGFWMLQASMFPENVASIRTHERVGFRVVGTRERIARFKARLPGWTDRQRCATQHCGSPPFDSVSQGVMLPSITLHG